MDFKIVFRRGKGYIQRVTPLVNVVWVVQACSESAGSTGTEGTSTARKEKNRRGKAARGSRD